VSPSKRSLHKKPQAPHCISHLCPPRQPTMTLVTWNISNPHIRHVRGGITVHVLYYCIIVLWILCVVPISPSTRMPPATPARHCQSVCHPQLRPRPCHAMPCHAMPCPPMPSHALPCPPMPSHAVHTWKVQRYLYGTCRLYGWQTLATGIAWRLIAQSPYRSSYRLQQPPTMSALLLLKYLHPLPDTRILHSSVVLSCYITAQRRSGDIYLYGHSHHERRARFIPIIQSHCILHTV